MHLRGSLGFLSTDVRRGWVLCNIVLAAGPIAVAVFAGSAHIFPATLTYSYALLVVGSYLFYRYFRSRDITEQSDTIFWSSIIYAVAILLILMSYSLNSRVLEIVNVHLAATIALSLVIIGVAFPLAYKLNWPIINEEEAKLEKARKEAEENYGEAEATRLAARKVGETVKLEMMEHNEDL